MAWPGCASAPSANWWMRCATWGHTSDTANAMAIVRSPFVPAAFEAGAAQDELDALAKRLSISTMIFHTLWLVSLILMVFRHAAA